MLNSLTLPFNWSEAKESPLRYVTTIEGVIVDLLTLTKVDLNDKLKYEGNLIYFEDKQVVKGNSSLSVIDYLKDNPLRLSGVGPYKSHCTIVNYDQVKEILTVKFTDNLYSTNLVKEKNLRTFGYSKEELLNLIESTGVIKRACLTTFVVINREPFYSWLGDEFMTENLFIENLKKSLNKEK
jgi:hypothetical protein